MAIATNPETNAPTGKFEIAELFEPDPGEPGLLEPVVVSLKSHEESLHLHSHLIGSQNIESQSEGNMHRLVVRDGVGLAKEGSAEGHP